MSKPGICFFTAFALIAVPGVAQAQMVAVDDSYSVPYSQTLVVQAPGVLENDTFNGGAATDHGATAALLVYTSHGNLTCPSQPTLDLCPDGSFDYTPYADFPGTDSFVYQADVGGQLDQATVTLSACSGGPDVFVCWKENSYLQKLGALGYANFQEGFEDDAVWGALRDPFTAASVINHGVRWASNHFGAPAYNELTTGTGAARTGSWGLFDPDHGYATGTPAECDVTNPPLYCFYKDGFTGTRQVGEPKLRGAGGYFSGSAAPNLVMILDGGAPIGLGQVYAGEIPFFGVINTAGFDTFRVEETDGKIGQLRRVFGDDFTLGTTPADTTPPQVVRVNSVADTGDGELSEGEITGAAITRLLVTFDELVRDSDYTGPDSVTNPSNYLLFSDGGDGFDTVDCLTGVDPGDVAFAVDWVTYVSGSERTATLDINGGVALPPGSYRLLVCGTTSICDWAGNLLDGDGNGMGGDDFQRNFAVSGSAPGYVPTTMRVDKSVVTPGSLTLSWSPSCSTAAVDYAIYEGTLGNYYSHTMKDCSDDGGDLVEEIVPQAADSYYLVVPMDASVEGSYGVDSASVERPRPAPADCCLPWQTLGGCP